MDYGQSILSPEWMDIRAATPEHSWIQDEILNALCGLGRECGYHAFTGKYA